MKETNRDILQIRAQIAAMEQTYEASIKLDNPPLVAGRQERLARINATMKFNAELHQLQGERK